jgi:hypothetical protein
MSWDVADLALKTPLLLRDALCPSRTNGSSIDESVATLVWQVPVEREGHHGPFLSRIATGKLKGERIVCSPHTKKVMQRDRHSRHEQDKD